MIFPDLIVYHQLSRLYFKCENAKQARWMNMNPFYIIADPAKVPEGYFDKQLK